MDIEDIKIGTELISKSKIAEIDGDNVIIQFTAPLKFRFSTEMFDLLDAQPCPKHDPCRRFKKGDKVRLIAHRGRIAYYEGLQYPPDRAVFIVEHDELKDGIVSIYEQPECDFDAFDIHFSFLELVTPVEALEPYSVETCQYGYTVNKGELILATYNDENHPHAKEAAEAECARLKAEYRKENSHE